MKLALGTVQFGTKYGISNQSGVPDDEELVKILGCAHESGITVLDCAAAYGNAEDRIGCYAQNRFDLISKFTGISDRQSLNGVLFQSLNRLRVKQLYAFIAHNADELIADPKIWHWLSLEKEVGNVKKIGYSLYTTEQLVQLLDMGMIPDIVQLPYNILDRKFENSLSELKQAGVEIHIRSVFLQGLLFLDTNRLPEKLLGIRQPLVTLHSICDKAGISVNQLALLFVKQNPFIDKIVIGVVSANQLLKNVEDFSGKEIDTELMREITSIEVSDKKLLNPANWN